MKLKKKINQPERVTWNRKVPPKSVDKLLTNLEQSPLKESVGQFQPETRLVAASVIQQGTSFRCKRFFKSAKHNAS